MTETDTSPSTWIRRWDAQQEAYIEHRERRFDVMNSFLETLLPDQPLVLDLACGPGTASDRVLRHLPGARCVAVDADPVLLHLGRRAYGDHGGRLRWVRADLTDPGWTSTLGDASFDAVISTTATHWLTPSQLSTVYEQVAGLLSPGGVLLNGDHLPLPGRFGRIRAAVAAVGERRQARALRDGADDWESWWTSLREDPELREPLAERDHLWPDSHGGRAVPGLAFHQEALTEAGFGEVAVVWQDLEERLLLAIR